MGLFIWAHQVGGGGIKRAARNKAGDPSKDVHRRSSRGGCSYRWWGLRLCYAWHGRSQASRSYATPPACSACTPVLARNCCCCNHSAGSHRPTAPRRQQPCPESPWIGSHRIPRLSARVRSRRSSRWRNSLQMRRRCHPTPSDRPRPEPEPRCETLGSPVVSSGRRRPPPRAPGHKRIAVRAGMLPFPRFPTQMFLSSLRGWKIQLGPLIRLLRRVLVAGWRR